MSFRKRNITLPSAEQPHSGLRDTLKPAAESVAQTPGTRPSPLDGRPTTSTGTRSLDGILAGHAGLAVGTTLLIEEGGATDFSATLLRAFTAEGVLQGHHVHVLGVNNDWTRDLPGLSHLADVANSENKKSLDTSKMKIAWRYERLGAFGKDKLRAQPLLSPNGALEASTFCHEFDISKRLMLPSPSMLMCVPISPRAGLDIEINLGTNCPFQDFIRYLTSQLLASGPRTVHRVVVPWLLSPASYPHAASNPEQVLKFLHSLRALHRKYPGQLTAFISLQLSLYPRATGLTRWIESLSDGVLELVPFVPQSSSYQGQNQAEQSQGLLRIHRLPISHERGGDGGFGHGDDLAFFLSRRKGLVIKPFSLPPVEGDNELGQNKVEDDQRKATKTDVEF